MKIATCENCKLAIFQNDECEWLHTHSNQRICSYDFAIPVEGTIQNRTERYDCTKCQQTHYFGEPLYQTHIMFQSKHGIKTGA